MDSEKRVSSSSDEKKFSFGQKHQNDYRPVMTKVIVRIDLDGLVSIPGKNVRNSFQFN